MSDYSIKIELPPGPAVTGAKAVVQEVAKVETAGKKAADAYKALGEVFRKVGEHEQRLARDAADARRAHDNLASSANGIAQAMRREQQILVELHGDMEQYKRDLQAIDSLHKRGAISAKEHAAAISSARGRVGMANPMDAVSLPNAPKAAGGGGMGMLAAGGLAGAGLAIGAKVLSDWQEYDKIQTQAFNTLRKYYDTAEQTESFLMAQGAAAKSLGVDLATMAGAFASVKEATDALNLTSLQQTKIARTLGEVMVLNGKPIEAASGLLEQLQLSMELGTMSAGQFRSMLKQFPDVVNMWGESMGMSSRQLSEMAAAGKIGEAELRKLFASLEDGAEVHKKMGDRQKTWTTHVKEFVGSGLLTDMKKDIEAQNLAMLEQADIYPRLLRQSMNYTNSIQKMTNAMKLAQGAAWLGAVGAQVGQFASRRALVDQYAGGADTRSAMSDRSELLALLAQYEASPASEERDFNIAEVNLALENMTKAVRENTEAIYSLDPDNVGLTGKVPRNVALPRNKYGDESETDPYYQAPVVSATAGWKPDGERYRFLSETKGNELEDPYADAAERQKEIIENTKKWHEELRKVDTVNEKIAEAMSGQLLSSAGEFSDLLVDAANGADVSWGKFFQGFMSDLQKAILKALILKGISAAFGAPTLSGGTGPLGGLPVPGFATGGDALWGAGALRRLPGAATGADWMTRGVGSTDSSLAMFRVTPGESIHVRTPQQRQEAMNTNTGARSVTVVYQQPDSRALLANIRGRDHDIAVLDVLSRNRGAVKALFG